MIIGYSRTFASGSPAVLSFVTHAENNPGGTSVSFSGVSIGAAAPDRLVIVGVHLGATSGNFSADPISSPVIGGVSATLAGNQVVVGGTVVAIYYAAVPAGATANIMFTGSVSLSSASVDVWAATNLNSSTPTATAQDTSGAANLTALLTINAGGFGVGVACTANNTSFTWTNLTERSDVSPAGAAGTTSGADSVSAGASQSITAAPLSGGSERAMSLAAWR